MYYAKNLSASDKLADILECIRKDKRYLNSLKAKGFLDNSELRNLIRLVIIDSLGPFRFAKKNETKIFYSFFYRDAYHPHNTANFPRKRFYYLKNYINRHSDWIISTVARFNK